MNTTEEIARMSDLTTTVTRYLDIWNEADADKRAAAIAELFTADAPYIDPLAAVEGHEGFGAVVAWRPRAVPGPRLRTARHHRRPPRPGPLPVGPGDRAGRRAGRHRLRRPGHRRRRAGSRASTASSTRSRPRNTAHARPTLREYRDRRCSRSRVPLDVRKVYPP
ncbi:nuclear transport factor 2 family protein [Streptomyces lasalocidi]